MTPDEQPIQIIANESNHVIEIEPGDSAHTENPGTTAEKAKVGEQLNEPFLNAATAQHSDEVATNDGAIIETLDTAFHNKPGVAEGENVSGSDRADYYEARSQGRTNAEEELDVLNKGQQL